MLFYVIWKDKIQYIPKLKFINKQIESNATPP